VNPFARSPLGKVVAAIAQIPHRPSDILGIKGSEWEKLLWDLAILSEGMKVERSVAEEIRAKKRRLGIYG